MTKNRPKSTKARARNSSTGTTPTGTQPAGTTPDQPEPPEPERPVAERATSTDATARAIETDGLTKRYGDHDALAPIDLTIPTGQRVSLIGHNGSGKTTLIKMLAGLLEPSGGTATVCGKPAGSPDARSALSYLSDQPVFYDDLSVRQHLEYISRLHRTDDWQDHADWLLDRVGLTARADDLPTTFSRGLKQKAAIAIAFVRPFETMLIDEPFVGLDRAGREALLGLMAWAHGDGATLVVATHELASVTSSDRLIALSDGEVIYDGDPAGADPNALSDGWFDPTGHADGDLSH